MSDRLNRRRENDKRRETSRLEEDGVTAWPNTVTASNQNHQNLSSPDKVKEEEEKKKKKKEQEEKEKEEKEKKVLKALVQLERFLNWMEVNGDRLAQAGLTLIGPYDCVQCECGIRYRGAMLLDNPDIRAQCGEGAVCEYANVSISG